MPPPTNRLSAQLARPFLVHLRSHLLATVLPIAARARAFHASSTAGQTEAKEGTPKATTNIHKLTPLTSEKHPEIKRDPKFSQLTDADLAHFHTLLPPTSILYSASPPTIASSNLMPYNLDWFNLYRGTSQLVLFPRTTHDVSLILSYCHARSLAVVPQGGNTGVSGGAVPVFDEVIVNMSKMNNVKGFDEISGVVVADAGIILEKLDEFLAERDHIVPLDLGAKGSCQVGGNVSTNAGGLRLMRFGSLHGSVLGLEVVLPDGTILDNLSTLRKDNTGYDLKQLFIGAEGTLGIVTGVSILTPRRPKAINVAMIALDSFDDVQRAFIKSREELSEILSAFEFWDTESLDVVRTKMLPDTRFPIESEKPYPFYALLETQGSRKEHDDEKLSQFLENLSQAGIARDGVIAQDAKQIRSLWSWRELIPEAITKVGPAITYDLSVEVPLLYRLCEDARRYLAENQMLAEQGGQILRVLGFGHVGDGNLHLMAATKTNDYAVQKFLDDYVFEWTAKHCGSISAEHGIGVMKVGYLHLSKSKEMIALMKQLKRVVDPKGIMNPYKVLQ